MGAISWLQPGYGIEFMGYKIPGRTYRLSGGDISFNFFSMSDWTIGWVSLLLKRPWRNTVNIYLIFSASNSSSLLQMQLAMILRKVRPPGWIVFSEWVHSRKILCPSMTVLWNLSIYQPLLLRSSVTSNVSVLFVYLNKMLESRCLDIMDMKMEKLVPSNHMF